MQVRVVIEMLSQDMSTRADFLKKFGARQDGRLMRFLFDDLREAEDALDLLASMKIEHQQFFRFKMTRQKLCRYPAVYLGARSLPAISGGVLDPEACGDCELAYDYETGWLCVSGAVQQLLAPLVRSTGYIVLPSVDSSRWFRMTVGTKLSHPIVVVAPLDVVPDEQKPERISVRGDGRSVIADSDAALVRENGITISESCLISGRERTWQPHYICSGSVMATLLESRVAGILESPLPLLLNRSAWADPDARLVPRDHKHVTPQT